MNVKDRIYIAAPKRRSLPLDLDGDRESNRSIGTVLILLVIVGILAAAYSALR